MQINDTIDKLNIKYLFKILAFLILSFPAFQYYGQLQGVLAAIVIPNHTCQYQNSTGNYSISTDQCLINVNGTTEKCQKWNFSREPVGSTIVSDFQLVCDRRYFGDVILTVWYVSSFTGLLMGWLADRYGRKPVTIFNVVLETIASILLAVSPNVSTSIIFRFFLGISASGVFISFVWLIESVDTEFREYIGSFFWLFGCLANLVFPGIIFLTKNWRYTQLFQIIPSILYLFILFIPESPRWLAVAGRKDDCIKSLKTIAKINKLNVVFDTNDIEYEENGESGDIIVALKTRTFLIRSAVTFFVQFSIYLIFSGIAINLSILSNNLLLSMLIIGLMETPGIIIAYFSLQYFKRKPSMIVLGIIGSVMIWLSIFSSRDIYWQSIIRIIIGGVAKAIITSANLISLVFVTELCPTSHRSLGIALIQLSEFIAFIGAIYINKLSSLQYAIPMSIYLAIMLISCLLLFFMLPETKNIPIPETLNDQDMLQVGKENQYSDYMTNKYKDGNIYINPRADERFENENSKLIDRISSES